MPETSDHTRELPRTQCLSFDVLTRKPLSGTGFHASERLTLLICTGFVLYLQQQAQGMDEAPLDRLNALTIVFDAMTNLGMESTISQFHEFETEIHLAISKLKKAGMWMRQIIPLVTRSVRVLQRMALVAAGHEAHGTSAHAPGLRTLNKESAELAAMVDAYASNDPIVFSDEMQKLPRTEESSGSHKSK